MSRAPLLLAIFSAVFFVVLLSEPTSSSSASSAVLPSARLAQYLHLQKTLESKGRKKRVTIRDVDTLRSKQSSKREHGAGDFEHHEAHGDHVHMDTKCGSVEHEQMMREKYPELGTKEDFEFLLREKMNERRVRMDKRAEVNPPVTLAVAVTVIHSGEAVGSGTNISPAQIASQIEVLNDDFGPTSGQGVNCQISFELSVVNRVSYQSKGWQAPPYAREYVDGVIKPATSVDPNKYLNVWVMSLTSGLLGYAQFPSNSGLAGLNEDGGLASTDGVVINYFAFGTVGNVISPYNGGRTTTHEIGHFLGLRHIWGDGAGTCASDYCDDTPPANQPHYGCPSPAPQSCSNTNQIQNYMDYTDDACMDRFMSCQRDRMYTVLEESPRRGGLIVFTNLTYDLELTLVTPESGAICLSNSFTSVTPEFAVSNAGFDTIYNATISIRIDGGAPSNSSFIFPGGLVQNDTMTVTWPSAVDLEALSEDVHSLSAEIFNLNGGNADQDPFSNTDSAVFYLSKNPPEDYSQDYEGIADFPPTGWVVPQNGWTGYTVVGADGSTGNSAVSPLYDLNRIGTEYPLTHFSGVTVGEEGSTVTFDISYAPYSNGTHVVTGDKLSIHVAAQCEDHEQVIYTKTALSLQTADATEARYFPSSSTEWRTESAVISNSNLFGKQVTISFISTTGWGNNLWLDNIRVTPGQNGAASGLSNWLSVVQ